MQRHANGTDEGWTALGRMLVRLGVIVPQIRKKYFVGVSAESKTGPVAYGHALKLFDEAEVVKRIGDYLSVPVLEVTRQNMGAYTRQLDDTILRKISVEEWRDYKAVPIGRRNGRLVVAFANPFENETKRAIDFALSEVCDLAVAREEDIMSILARRLSTTFDDTLPFLEEASAASGGQYADDSGGAESNVTTIDVEAAPVIRLVNKVLLDALDRGASDIHMSPERDGLKVKIRADGMIYDLMKVPREYSASVISRFKLLANMDIAERRRPQDGRFRVQAGNETRDLRVSTVPALHGENVVARILRSDAGNMTFDSLNMPAHILQHLQRDLSGTSQMVLVTGPTGSGKTSTLYGSILHLRNGHRNIVTIEDPVEYRVQGVTQLQVNEKIGVTFPETIRSVLRQDPDVVVIGEIRDAETAQVAMQVAQTGHLVLGTLHTISSPAAVTRLKDLGISAQLIASSVRGILAQRLVRRLCPTCARPAGEELLNMYPLPKTKDSALKEAVGCEECNGTGYSGRVGVYSYLHISPEVLELIRNNASESEIERAATRQGYQSLPMAALQIVMEGVTSVDEATRVVGPLYEPPPLPAPQSYSPPQPTPEPIPAPATASAAYQGPPILRHSPPPPGTQPGPSLELESSELTLADEPPKKRRILIVEDNENMRTVLAMTLKKAMYDVIPVADGQSALKSIYGQRPDLIVCDLMMPCMNGMETVEILRRDPRTRRIPIIILTSADQEENELALLKCGADDFVSKAKHHKLLLTRIERLLERSVTQ